MKKPTKPIRKHFLDSLDWLFYSVAIGLVHLLVGWIIFKFTGDPLLQRSFTEGSLFLFATVLITTTYANNHKSIRLKKRPFLSRGFSIGCLVVASTSILAYMANISNLVKEVPYPSARLVLSASIILSVFTILYGLALTNFVNFVNIKPRGGAAK